MLFLPKKQLAVPFLLAVLIAPLLISAASADASASPETWNRTFEDLEGMGHCVIQTQDGGYAVAGISSGQFLLLKVSSLGEVEWSKTYGEGAALSLVQSSDGGYALAGNATDFNFLKTDPNGNMLWKKTYGDMEDCLFLIYSLISTDDGGYALAGYNFNQTLPNNNNTLSPLVPGSIVRIDANGNILWKKTYSQEFPQMAISWINAIAQTSDGGYVTAGQNRIAKLNSNGDREWTRDASGMSYFIIPLSDGGYVIPATKSLNLPEETFGLASLLVKTDSQGNWIWSKTLLDGNYSTLYSGIQTSDEGFVVAGTFAAERYIETLENGSRTLSTNSTYISGAMKLDASGNPEGNITFSENKNGNMIFSIIESSDGDYVFTGVNFGDEGVASLWLVKTEIQATPDNAPPTIVVLSPKNQTYETAPYLTFTTDEPVSWMGYRIDDGAQTTVTGNTTLSGLPVGTHKLVVYANDNSGNAGTSETVYFTTTSTNPPNASPTQSASQSSILISSPTSQQTFTKPDVPLTFTVTEGASWMRYSLDGQQSVTVVGNATLAGLTDGTHSIVVYVGDAEGNSWSSDTVQFNVDTKQAGFDYYTIAFIGAMVLAVSFGLFLYTRRNPTANEEKLRGGGA